MYSLDSIFIFYLIGFLLAIFIAFYIPGRVLLGQQKIKHKKALPIIAIIVGIVLWALQGYLLGLIQLRWLTYLYLLIFLGIFIFKKYYKEIKFSLPSFKKIDFIIVVIAILGVGAQILPFLQMGQQTQQGVMLMNINSIDHFWHAGIVRELVDHFPPQEPGMSGILLKDYHYWFNLITADLIRIFHFPPLFVQFLGMYTLASVLLVFVMYYFVKLIYDNRFFIRLFLFFIFFCGDATIWIITFLQHQIILSLPSLINNGTKFVDSPGFAYSILVGFTAFYLLFQQKKLSKKIIFICALLFGSLFEFKVYTAITFMLGLCALAVYSFFKREFDRVLVFILASVFGALILFPNMSSGSGLFFLPFEVPRDFITQKALGFYDWELRWRIYQEHNNYIRIVQYGIYMSVFYLIAQFGLQLVGLLPLRRVCVVLSSDKTLTFYAIIFFGTALTLFFYQTVGGANIWEFLLPVGFFLSLLSALTVTKLLENKNRLVVFIVISIIVIIVIPRWMVTVYENIKSEYLSGFHGISTKEYVAYEYLRHNVKPGEIVLIANHPYRVQLVSYVKIFSRAQLYLSGEGTRQLVTPEIQKRRDLVESMRTGYAKEDLFILNNEKVKYLFYYSTPKAELPADREKDIVFHNSEATIINVAK